MVRAAADGAGLQLAAAGEWGVKAGSRASHVSGKTKTFIF